MVIMFRKQLNISVPKERGQVYLQYFRFCVFKYFCFCCYFRAQFFRSVYTSRTECQSLKWQFQVIIAFSTVLLLIHQNACPSLYGFCDALGNLVAQMLQSATRADKAFEYLLWTSLRLPVRDPEPHTAVTLVTLAGRGAQGWASRTSGAVNAAQGVAWLCVWVSQAHTGADGLPASPPWFQGRVLLASCQQWPAEKSPILMARQS